jgi:hypothetical protein
MLQPYIGSYIGYTPLVLVLVGVFTFLLVSAADWHVFFRRNPRTSGFVLPPHREGVGNVIIEKAVDSLTTPGPTLSRKPPVAPFKWRPTRATIISYSGRALVLGGKTGVAVGASLGVVGIIGVHIPWVDPNPVGNWYLKKYQGYGYDSIAGHMRHNELFDVKGFDAKARSSCINPKTGNMGHQLMGEWMDAHSEACASMTKPQKILARKPVGLWPL